MAKSRSVVHVTPSVLAGAPASLSAALNGHTGFQSAVIQTGDFSDSRRLTQAANVVRFGGQDHADRLCRELLSEADVIHVHNTVSPHFAPFLAGVRTRARWVYHLHSPPRERPIFLSHQNHLGLPFDATFAVSHFHPRCYQTAIPMPNVVLRSSPPRERKPGEPLTIVFSPSHRTSGRWNSKVTPEFDSAMEWLSRMDGIDVQSIENATPDELFEIRRRADVTVDEVVTGSFHLVSLEGLAVGNVVLNDADEFTLWAASMGFRTETPPPFLRTRARSLLEVAVRLRDDSAGVAEMKAASYDYYRKYLQPARLAGIYADEYERVLGGASR